MKYFCDCPNNKNYASSKQERKKFDTEEQNNRSCLPNFCGTADESHLR